MLHEKNGTLQSKAYQDAYSEYFKIHWCRIFPYPKEAQEVLDNWNIQVYETMWGSNEFFSTGNLKDFDRTDILKRIRIPTLFTCGRYDLTTSETTKGFADQVKNSEFVVFKKSAHLPMYEEPEAYVKVIRDFLNKNE